MTISVLLASGTTAANSADVVLYDEAATLICRGNGTIIVEIKNSSNTYQLVDYIRSNASSIKQIRGPATFRVRRELSPVAVGIDMDKT